MFGDIALELIKMMGHSAKVPGALSAADVPLALDKLTAAIEIAKDLPSPKPQANPDQNDDEEAPSVSLPHRALPLINMLKAAAKDETYVMWE
jgi:hypothetical protein